jgi:FHA domain
MICRLLPAVVFFAALASAQDASQQMISLSVRVVGAVQKDGQAQAAWSGAGVLLDSKHVATVNLCCGKTQDGTQKTAVILQGQNGIVAQPVWSGEGGLVILELQKPLQSPGPTLSPVKLTLQNESAYTVVFPNGAAPTVSEAKIQGVFKPDKVDAQVYKAAPAADNMPAGGAMFNACGQVVGINVVVDQGVQLAVAADTLIPGLEKAGVQVPLADKECGGAQSDSGNPPPADKGGDKDGDKGGEKGGEKSSPLPAWMPKGDQWIGVAVIVGLIGLAMRRNTRQQVARTLTRRRMPPPPPMRAARPVLKGIAGQYAGAAIALDSGPSLLGRDQSAANLVFSADSDSVSKRHCVVRWDAARGVFTLEDLGSTNGTFLSTGERLPPGQPRDLRPGERFYIGDLRNQFEVSTEG